MNPLTPDLREKAGTTLAALKERLFAQFNPERPWTGRLSDSAVATSIAVFALHTVDAAAHESLIRRGIGWLVSSQRPDGGWGDSPESPSNLSATLLTWCALGATRNEPAALAAAARCEEWLSKTLGGINPDRIVAGVVARYRNDRTFASPILTTCALAGRLGPEPAAWAYVPQLPFELAVFPPWTFRALNLTVVSYALPALIAVGLVRHKRTGRDRRLSGMIRNAMTGRVLKIAASMQPSNGGYEEAAPLTAFVTMSLAAAGYGHHEIIRRGVGFLIRSVSPNGSWPIDTDLATWVTVQSVHALAVAADEPWLTAERRDQIRRWLLAQQAGERHPLTFGAPGGWGWTDLPGAMPDADDTSGVLLALRQLGKPEPATCAAAARGLRWLINLQNRDGGIPTFSRGWGKLPFDRSCPDITANALHAFAVWLDDAPAGLRMDMRRAIRRMVGYLQASRTPEGAWLPLWFGTQKTPDEQNPVYGTARAVLSLTAAEEALPGIAGDLLERGTRFLLSAQNDDGGWGPRKGVASGIEETAMALWAVSPADAAEAVSRGVEWLVKRTDNGRGGVAAPIGLYFDRLWFSESMYPLAFSIGALNSAMAPFGSRPCC